jgi:DNA mismatch repair ATPase MutL
MAGNVGTTIIVDNLFHNMPVRQQAMRNANDEHERIKNVRPLCGTHNKQV